MRKILLAIDGSEASLAAVRCALGWVHAGLRAEFVLVNVQEPASLYEMLVARDIGELDTVALGAAEHLLEPAERLMRERGVAFEREIASGDPETELIAAAERHGCDGIVLGTTGKASPEGVLGSVAEALARESPITVTLVRLREV